MSKKNTRCTWVCGIGKVNSGATNLGSLRERLKEVEKGRLGQDRMNM
jgi:hypothetical protein